MNVSVHLHTILQRQTPEGLVRQLELSVPPQSNISDLLTKLEIDFPLDSLLLVVNGRLVEPDHILVEGDKVNLMPAISGGQTPHPCPVLV
jgi:sulfur carrier protein ThiS